MMERIKVDYGAGGYSVLIGQGILRQAGEMLRAELGPVPKVFVVTDSHVATHWLQPLEVSLTAAGYAMSRLVLPPGEETKSAQWLAALYDAFAEAGLHREDLVLALGGGVVGDLAGYAAATWMRGVPIVQMPTTLLAQVDASLGGKTAINLPYGKNLVGAFHQPRLVLADPLCLQTLPAREMRSGMAEVIKYSAIQSAPLFDALTGAVPPLTSIITSCCRIKAEIVSFDAQDHGLRKTLNFGHTFGHAIEWMGEPGAFTHGEAVAIGMVLAARIGEGLGETEAGTADKLRAVLAFHGLPCDSPWSPKALISRVLADKKAVSGGVEMLLLPRIGAVCRRVIGQAALRDALGRL